jgi:hypothetical protein
MYYYTIEDYDEIRTNMGSASVLSTELFDTLRYLENELKKHATTSEPSQHVQPHNNHEHSNNNNNNNNKKSRSGQATVVRRAPTSGGNAGANEKSRNSAGSSKHSVSAEDWESLRNFKPTKKTETVEGPDKIINDIRMTLNKITQKTYDNLKASILKSFEECIKQFPDDVTMQKLSKHFFDIVVRDRFLTDIYVDLYLALIECFPSFENQFAERVIIYRATIDHMQYVDPQKDYDGYCNYVKFNDQRKAMTLFIIQLFKKGKVSESDMIDLMVFLLNKTRMNRDKVGRTNEVEEITENFYLAYLHCNVLLETHPEWKSFIVPTIREFAEMQLGSFPSISSRALLKYQDIIEGLDEY